MRLRRRAPGILLLLAAALLATIAISGTALAANLKWRFAPAANSSIGSGIPSALPLGKVGEISFWAPNRGLLIAEGTTGCKTTGTTAGAPCGLYAYNGGGWHLLSTVCGATDGRIAWEGADAFWTISDQRPGNVTEHAVEQEPQDVSLCHFVNGEVLASYAQPFDQPTSYKAMDAAACLPEGSPQSSCWFGGRLGTPSSKGAFHLHWDGHNLTTVYSPLGHEVSSMALACETAECAATPTLHPPALFESVQLGGNDEYGTEDPEHPAVLHQIDPPGSSIDFHDVFLPAPICRLSTKCGPDEFSECPLEAAECPPLPDYGLDGGGERVAPRTLAGLLLSSDYTPSGVNRAPSQVWAVAGPGETGPPSGKGVARGIAHPIALRYFDGAWTQVVGDNEAGGGNPFAAEQEELKGIGQLFAGVAAEPGSPAAWLAVNSHDEEAHVDRLQAEGEGSEAKATVSQRETLGEKAGPEGPGKPGSAGPIACPAANDCWLATSKGWLYHLTEDAGNPDSTDGYPLDTDPNFAGVITFRPEDEGTPQLPSIEPPADDSLANQLESALPTTAVQAPTARTAKALVTDVSSHIVHRYTLELSFKLTVKAHVQLVASRKSRKVAETARETLKAGKHMLTLRLNPRSWPNKLDLKATPLEPLPTVEVKGVTGHTVAPPVASNSAET